MIRGQKIEPKKENNFHASNIFILNQNKPGWKKKKLEYFTVEKIFKEHLSEKQNQL